VWCGKEAVAGERYCRQCKKLVLKEMEQAGYLERRPARSPTRDKEARENTRETKFGVDR
jgi:hypothetical protein